MAKEFNRKSTKRKPCKPCRLCGKSSRTYKNIFKASIKLLEENPENKIINYSYKPVSVVIQECLNFHITTGNQASNIVCTKCIKELTSWSTFQNQCLHQQLSSGLKPATLQTDHSLEKNDKSSVTQISEDNSTDFREIIISEKDNILSYHEPINKQKKKAFEKCPNCKTIFKNSNEHSIHRSTDKGCFFTCSQCFKEFRSKDTLRNHLEIHSSINNFCCHICGLLFTTRNRLYHHIHSHEATKRFHCTYCSKQFTIASDLQKHIRTHTGERPYQCSECDARFTQYSLVVRHIEGVHRKTKRFTCSICSKTFLYKNHFSAHLMLHSGQKDMVCDICNKSFVTKNALFRHQRNHTGEKPYPCPECGKRFADCSNRKRHVIQHHSSKNSEFTKKAVDRSKKKGKLQQCKNTEIIDKSKDNKPLHTLRTFLEDPELLLGNLNEKRDVSINNIEEMSTNTIPPPDVFVEFNEAASSHNSDIQNCENNTLTLTVLDDDDNRSLEFFSNNLLQYDNILPRIDEENFLEIKNKLISNGIEQSENYTGTNKLEEFQNIFNQTDVDKDRLNTSIQCHNLSSTDVLNLELALGTLSTEQVDVQQRWAADILNNIAPCETQSILKMLNNQGTILLTFPENEDFSA